MPGRVERLLGLLPWAVLLMDRDLAVVSHNGVARTLLDLPPSQDGDLLEHVHPEDAAVLLAAAVAAREAPPGWSVPVRVRWRHADGSWRTWAMRTDNRLDDPELQAVVVVGEDVTAVGADPPLAEADRLLRELVTHAPVAMLVLDAEGVVRLAAGAALEVEPSVLVGRPLREVAQSREQEEGLARALAGEPVESLTEWGGKHWLARYTPLRNGPRSGGVVVAFTDESARMRAEARLARSEAHLRAVIETVQEAILVLDLDGSVSLANSRCEALYGAPIPVGTSLWDLLDPDVSEEVRAQLERRAEGVHARYELRFRDVHGQHVWVRVSASPMRSAEGEPVGSVAVLVDISEHKATERRLTDMAQLDPVTGVASRTTLDDRLAQALARRGDGVAAVLFCDIDRMKEVNDRLGHAAGDALLRHVAGAARSALRPADTIARFGGDEFVVVCEDLHDADEAVRLAERIRAAVGQPFEVAATTLRAAMSIGVATSPPHLGPDQLLGAADGALYAAKRAGRDRVRLAGRPGPERGDERPMPTQDLPRPDGR